MRKKEVETEEVIAKNNNKILCNEEILLKTKKKNPEGHLITYFLFLADTHLSSLFLRSEYKKLTVHIEMIKNCFSMFCNWVLANLSFSIKEKTDNSEDRCLK